MTRCSVYELQFSVNLWLGCCEEFTNPLCSGFGPARDTCNFPESDPVWSSFMGSGSGPARASCAFSGSDTGMLTPDVPVGTSLFYLVFCHPLGSKRFLFHFLFLSESDVDGDSWITSLMLSFQLRKGSTVVDSGGLQRPFPCLLLHAVWKLFLILGSDRFTPPTGAPILVPEKVDPKLSLIARSRSASSPSPSPLFLEVFLGRDRTGLDCLTGVVVVGFLGVARFVADIRTSMDVVITCTSSRVSLWKPSIRDQERSYFLLWSSDCFVACFTGNGCRDLSLPKVFTVKHGGASIDFPPRLIHIIHVYRINSPVQDYPAIKQNQSLCHQAEIADIAEGMCTCLEEVGITQDVH
ncbi:hypothetical protein Tco_0592769 [Tanacetum coccineum]